jgi:peptidoglycan/LPS O-acetylase OafA/YrhL
MSRTPYSPEYKAAMGASWSSSQTSPAEPGTAELPRRGEHDESPITLRQPSRLKSLAKAHLGEMDYLRVFGLTSIVLIHSISFFFSLPDANLMSHNLQGLVVNLLRYGRFVFMFTTGLVFFYSYRARDLDPHRFYGRRLKNLVIPYAVWTALYLLLDRWSNMVKWSGAAGFGAIWLQNLLSGNAFEHLYYIVVTIQFYLLLPFLLARFKPILARKGRPGLWVAILLASGLLISIVYFYGFECQAAAITSLVAGKPWQGVVAWVLMWNDRLVFSYLPFYLLGGLAGLYLEECRKWINDHPGLIGVGLLISAALVSGQYFYNFVHLGQAWDLTISVFKPSIYFFSLFVVAALFRVSLSMNRNGSLLPLVKLLSSNSLGIYLMHPAVLFFLHSYVWSQTPGSLSVIIDPLAAIAISCLITQLIASNKYTRFIVGEAGK